MEIHIACPVAVRGGDDTGWREHPAGRAVCLARGRAERMTNTTVFVPVLSVRDGLWVPCLVC